MKKILLTASKIGLIGFAGIFICVSCSMQVKDQYKTLYKTTIQSQSGGASISTMPFYKEDNIHIAIEWNKSPEKAFFHFTVLYQYEQDKSLANSQYFLFEAGIQINNGRAVTVKPGSSKEWTGLGSKVKVVEKMIIPLDDTMVQSLRDCTALSLTVLGQTKSISAEAIGKIREFIQAR